LHSLLVLASLWLGGLPGCADECVTKTGNPSDHCGAPLGSGPVINSLARQCGIDVACQGAGLREGNAAISGVQSIDSYFASVLRFETEADRLSSALDAEVDAIGVAIGVEGDVAAALRARIDASVEGGLRVRAGTPSCEVDSDVVLYAGVQCEGEDTGGQVACGGRCELPLGGELECDGTGELFCTFFASAIPCEGECTGTCANAGSAPSACTGVCRGDCSGDCSLYSDAAATQCAGHCDGMCTGSCEVELVEAGSCDGACSGTCTVPSVDGRCDGASTAFCEAAPTAAVTCAGRCDGELVARRARRECDVAAEAQGRMSMQCTAPRVAIEYQLKSGLDAEASAQFKFEMQMLQRRLPILLMTVARAEQTLSAGAELVAHASSTLHEAMTNAGGTPDLRITFGLVCAASEADRIPEVVDDAASRLEASLGAAAELAQALDLQ
jgi:hypothetical protein